MIEQNICHFCKILHPRRYAIMCQNGAASSLHHWIDSGSIATQYGLSKWIWINPYHLFLNMLTHNSHTCDSFVTRNWFIVQSDSPSVMHCLSPELAYIKHGNTKEIQVVIIMTTWVMTMLASVQWHTKYLTNILWYHCTIYDNLTYSTTVNLLSKYDMNQYFTLVTKLS